MEFKGDSLLQQSLKIFDIIIFIHYHRKRIHFCQHIFIWWFVKCSVFNTESYQITLLSVIQRQSIISYQIKHFWFLHRSFCLMGKTHTRLIRNSDWLLAGRSEKNFKSWEIKCDACKSICFVSGMTSWAKLLMRKPKHKKSIVILR